MALKNRSLIGRLSLVLAIVTSMSVAGWLLGGTAEASHTGYVDIGSTANNATATTGVSTTAGNGLQGISTDANASGLYGQNDNHGYGVAGRSQGCSAASDICSGVLGEGGREGIRGNGSVGVHGDAANVIGSVWPNPIVGVFGESVYREGVRGQGGNVGVHGINTDCQGLCDGPGPGVWGESNEAGGQGVRGTAPNGIGVLAESGNGTALSVAGVAMFSRSGVAVVAAGTSSITVPGVALTNQSMVLATMQVKRGAISILAADPAPAADSIRISLSGTVTQNTPVAWFVLN
jgi:hypothetical protein